MVGALILIIILFVISYFILEEIGSKKRWFDKNLMIYLFWYHIFFAGVYYVMALSAPSDSVEYYNRPQYAYMQWIDAFIAGTPFIDFIGYPFINYLHFSYEMMMVLFSWFGFWGFVCFYIFFKEHIKYKHTVLGYDFITICMFLPNMHYWTASYGKGSLIFMGLAMATLGISKIKSRKILLILGLFIVYYVRPFIFLFMGVAILVGFFTGKQKVPLYQKFIVVTGSAVALILSYNTIINFVGLDSDNLVQSFDQFSSHRAYELSNANSGVDISNYPLILKLFTFWFRPLFVDAPGFSGLIVSFENVLYLFLGLKLINRNFVSYVAKSPALVKISIVIFLSTSLALSQTLSNMGIIIRQKSMVMYYFLFIIIMYMDYNTSCAVFRKQQAIEKFKLKRRQLSVSEL